MSHIVPVIIAWSAPLPFLDKKSLLGLPFVPALETVAWPSCFMICMLDTVA
jgi:hypothetical protein